MLSGEEIRESLGASIIIHPFDPEKLRGACYNLRVGKYVWLHPYVDAGGQLHASATLLRATEKATGRQFIIPPGAIACILTEEIVGVDATVAGLLHSKVDMATKGFSHVSTTLDPGWIGPLLITMRNERYEPLELWEHETFVKISFYKLSRPTAVVHNNPPGRADLIAKLGFELPAGQQDLFEEQRQYWDRDALRQAFWSAEFGKQLSAERNAERERVVAEEGRAAADREAGAARAAAAMRLAEVRRWRWVVFLVATVTFVAAISAPWWFKPVFRIDLNNDAKALATVLTIAFSGLWVFLQMLKDPPWHE
jgi:deoxycytidine triphosphate deaminase